MKKFFTCIFMLCLFAGYSQNAIDVPATSKIPSQFSTKRTIDPASYSSNLTPAKRLPRNTSGSRAQNLGFYIDHGFLDQEYATNVTFGDYYENAIYQLGRNLPQDSVNTSKWMFTWYPRIIDAVNSPAWPYIEYPADKIQMVIDTVFLNLGHINNSNTTDTIMVSVWDLDALTTISVADSGCTGTLYGRILYTVDTSLTGPGTQPGQVFIGVFPFVPSAPIVIPQGKRFIIQVDFFGANSDEFYLVAGRRNDCGNATCGASVPYVNATYNAALSEFNSVGNFRYFDGTNYGVYPSTGFYNDCNNNQQQDTAASACELIALQDLGIYPNIQAVIPDFYASIEATPATGCPGALVTLTASSAGSTALPLTYAWSTTSGTLTSPNDQSTQLNIAGNAIVTVTVTDAASQTVTASFNVASRAISINISNSAPVQLACSGGTGSITLTTTVSGTTTGRTYTWSSGQTGGNTFSTVPVTLPGTYTVTVVNSSGCSATASTNVVYPGVTNTVSFTPPTPPVCKDVPVTFVNTSSNTNGWTATWYPLGTTVEFFNTTGAANATYTYTGLGFFPSYMEMDSAGCKFKSAVRNVQVQNCVGIDDVSFESAITMLPNPSNGNVTITVSEVEKYLSIKVYNIIGSQVKSFTTNEVANTAIKSFDVSELANGTYLVKIETAGKTAVKRLIVNR